jgi:hypothetical protein
MRRFFERAAQDAAGLVDRARTLANPLEGPEDLDPLVDRIGDARCVLLGEASHGTSEFYTWRARISERLIQELRIEQVRPVPVCQEAAHSRQCGDRGEDPPSPARPFASGKFSWMYPPHLALLRCVLSQATRVHLRTLPRSRVGTI